MWLSQQPNHPASGNGAVASLFHVERLWRAVPEPGCWAGMRWQIFALMLLALLAAGQGCRITPSSAEAAPWGTPMPTQALRVEKADKLRVVCYDLPSSPPRFEVFQMVGKDGTITLISNQVFVAAGKGLYELEAEIYNRYFPRVFTETVVRVQDAGSDWYCVFGEVSSPGRQTFWPPTTTLLEAIESAGGFTEAADRKRLELQRVDGRVERYNYNKILSAPTNTPCVMPGDRVTVKKRRLLW
jgi:protein involved in polysaccharide export with SLBB domain